MYVEGQLRFLTLEKWPSVGDVLCVPAVHSPLITKGQGPGGPRVVSDLCLQTQFHRVEAIVVFFLLVSVCPLVGEACLEACAGFLVGVTGASALVGGAGSWPSGGWPCKGRV